MTFTKFPSQTPFHSHQKPHPHLIAPLPLPLLPFNPLYNRPMTQRTILIPPPKPIIQALLMENVQTA